MVKFKIFSSSIFIIILLFSSLKSEEYKLGPSDVIEIIVWDESDLSGTFQVSSKGTIAHPLLRDFPVAGKTVSQVTSEITQALKKDYLVDPRVNVVIKEYHSKKVYLFGMVQKPGIYELQEDSSLLKLLLNAGGITQEAGEIVKIMRVVNFSQENGILKNIENAELKNITTNIKKLFNEGDLTQNVNLQNGDIIFVPYRDDSNLEEDKCYVLGEVKKPGAFKVTKGYKVLSAIIDAGGFTDFASPNNTKLIRGSGKDRKVIKLKMKDIMEKGAAQEDNILVEPSDLIIVPGGIF